jgi:hypothetical protein
MDAEDLDASFPAIRRATEMMRRRLTPQHCEHTKKRRERACELQRHEGVVFPQPASRIPMLRMTLTPPVEAAMLRRGRTLPPEMAQRRRLPAMHAAAAHGSDEPAVKAASLLGEAPVGTAAEVSAELYEGVEKVLLPPGFAAQVRQEALASYAHDRTLRLQRLVVQRRE